MKVKSTLLILATSMATIAMGQSAPYLSVTDTDGIEHDLYEKYVREGKSVMLGIFFSSCAPCQLIADDLQALYEEWGAGASDVEFIEISSEDWETDETAEAYRVVLDLTFPVVSAEGGSLAAVDSLVNGGFGSFYGAPLYLVVGPDSSVQWNLFGFGNAATIAAIDEALLATGAMKPTTGLNTSFENLHHIVDIYPNPANDILNISGKTSFEMVELISISGSCVLTRKMTAPASTTQIDISELQPGTYLIRLSGRGQATISSKFMKT